MKKIYLSITRYRVFDILFLLALSIFCFRIWFKPGMIAYGDWSYYPKDFLMELAASPLCWATRFFSGPGFMLHGWPIQWIMGFIARLGFDFGVAERVVYFFPYAVISVLGIYYLTYVLFKKRVICFFSTLFYIFNTFTLIVVAGAVLARMVAYALMPLAVVFFIKAKTEKKFINHLLSGLLLTVMTFYELRVAYLTVGVIFLFFSQYVFQLIINKERSLKNITMSFLYLGVVLVIPFLLNFYWIYASLAAKTSYMPSGYELSGAVKALSYFKLSHCLAVYFPWWPRGAQPSIIYYLVPLLVFMAIVFRPKDTYVRLLTFLAIISILLTMGANRPFGSVYIWLFKHFPGFDAFRDPGKFCMLICFAYAPLLGVSVGAIASKLGKMHFKRLPLPIKRKYLSPIFLSAVFFILIYIIWPVMTGKIGGVFAEGHHMLKEYKRIEEFIKNQNVSFRTFWRPHLGRFAYYSSRFPLFCAYKTSPATRFFFGENWNAYVFNRSKYIAKVLGLLNVKYCFVPLEEKYQKLLGKDKTFYVSTYQNKVGLKQINLGDNIDVFENEYFVPRIFAADRSSLVVGSKKSLLDLADFEGIDISSFALFFSDEMTIQNKELLANADTVIFYDTDISDLVINSVPGEYRFDLTKCATRADETVPDRWHRVTVFPMDSYGYLYGAMAQNPGGGIYAQSGWECRLVNPVEVSIEEPGSFEVWIRAMKGIGVSPLSIWMSNSRDLDDSRISILKDKELGGSNFYFRWIKAGRVNFDKGKYFFDISEKSGGMGLLDQLVIIPQKKVDTLYQEISKSLESKNIVIFKNCDSSSIDISIPKDGKYHIITQMKTDNFSGNLDIFVNGHVVKSLNLDKAEKTFYAGQVEAQLNKGDNQISLTKLDGGEVRLQRLILFKANDPVDSIEEIFTRGKRIPVDWKMISPTKYEVKVTAERPVYLLFSDVFDPRWTLKLAHPVHSISAYGMINSFFVSQPGKIETTIEFVPQRYIYQGLIVSGMGFVLICGSLLYAGISSFTRRKKCPKT